MFRRLRNIPGYEVLLPRCAIGDESLKKIRCFKEAESEKERDIRIAEFERDYATEESPIYSDTTSWERPEGGGGRSRVMQEGRIF